MYNVIKREQIKELQDVRLWRNCSTWNRLAGEAMNACIIMSYDLSEQLK